MQKVMDEYAGGISTGCRYNARQLERADEEIRTLAPLVDRLRARTPFELLAIYELRERLTVCRVLIAHMAARKETRWHAFAERTDYPEARPEFEAYVNSRLEDGDIRIVLRDLVGKGERLEHLDR